FGALYNLSGTFLAAGPLSLPFGFQTEYRLVANQFRVHLGVASDIDLLPNLVLTPSIAAYGRTFLNFELSQNVLAAGVNYAVHAHTHWWDIGGKIGGKLTDKVTPWLGVFVGGDASLAHRRAELDATDGANVGGPTVFSSIDVTRNRFAVMGA